MYNFREFIREQTEPEPLKLKHLTHAEDHVIDSGETGYHHAVKILKQAHEHITKGASESKVTTKYDGSPSIVFGHHPDTGKFFVATKSAFNVNPKINYTEKDIDKNHGHAPGLANKLKEALRHLPKVAPKKGVYQGDLMYGHGDVKDEKNHYHFTPNTITYSAKKGTPEANKIEKSKMGIVVHTKYHGPSFEKMSAGFDPDTHNFKHHPDVNIINHETDMSKVKHTPENESAFHHHMAAAEKAVKKAPHDTFEVTTPHKEHLNTYINSTVVSGEKPSVKGYKEHITNKFNKQIDKLSSPAGKLKKQTELLHHLQHVDKHEKHFNSLFEIHHHLQQAKNALVKSLASHPTFKHSVGGTSTGPEGFVITHHGQPTKLVDRAEFSRQNFLKSRNRKPEINK
jgi:Family of unknown function (DUF6267)